MAPDAEQNNKQSSAAISVIMAAALLLLAVVLGKNAILMLADGSIFRGCISAVGTVLSLGVSLILGIELVKQHKRKRSKREEPDHGH